MSSIKYTVIIGLLSSISIHTSALNLDAEIAKQQKKYEQLELQIQGKKLASTQNWNDPEAQQLKVKLIKKRAPIK